MRKKHLMTTVALMLLTATLTFSITIYAAERGYNAKLANIAQREQEYAKIAEVRSYIDKYFVREYDEKDITDGALYGMVAMLGDKWSYYLTAEQFSSVTNSTANKVVGIGINASFDYDKSEIVILEVFDNSPAKEANLQPFDRIVKVGNEEVSKIGYDAAVKKITGAAGTTVSITVTRKGLDDPMVLNLTRREVNVQGVSAKILDGNIGYIKISNFDANVDKDFKATLENLVKANVSAIIFDVRNNPGGILQVLVNSLDPLLPEGKVIIERDKKGKEIVYTSDKNELNLPMAVLTNEYSISAAEFFAAALSESGKAIVVGTPTTGKGVAQSHIKLRDGSGLILSVSEYFTASGKSLEETGGIVPDKVVELTEDEEKRFYFLSEKEDRQLQEAIKAINEKEAQKADVEENKGSADEAAEEAVDQNAVETPEQAPQETVKEAVKEAISKVAEKVAEAANPKTEE